MVRRVFIVLLLLVCLGFWLFHSGQEGTDLAATPETSQVSDRTQAAQPVTAITEESTDPVAGPDAREVPPQDNHSSVYRIATTTGQRMDWTGSDPASHRTETVRINHDPLTRDPVLKEGDRLQVAFFGMDPLESVVSDVTVWANGTVAVTAKLDSDPYGRMFLSYTGDHVAMLVQDHASGTTYKLDYEPALGEHVVHEVDLAASNIVSCGNHAEADTCAHHDHGHSHDHGHRHDNEPGTLTAMPLSSGTALPETVTLDVMIVYTPAIRQYEGSVADMQNSISLGMQLANDTHANSDTRVVLNLVHSEEVAYTEDNPEDANSPDKYINAVTETDDGIIDNVHTLRDTYAADYVVFVVKTQQTGGYAWIPYAYDRDDIAFCIVRGQQLDYTYTMVHEIGHNMGLGHSATQQNAPFTDGIYPYAAGWQWADSSSSATIGYCSVMTYENFSSQPGTEYRRVAHFSNPEILYNGNPTGSSNEADAARVIRNGRFDFSGFRGPKAVPTQAVTDFPDLLTFEEYFGIWYQPDTDSKDWRRQQSGTPSPNTGPPSAYRDIFYAYIETSTGNANDEAILQTIVDFQNLTAPRITFAYHMYGSTMGSLHLEASTDGSSWSPLWSLSGNQGNLWQLAEVDLSPYTGQLIQLRFRGIQGSSFRSDMALDNIAIEESPPPPSFTTFINEEYPELSDKSPEGDPDKDGINNFLEYAFGMSLDFAEREGAPSSTYNAPGQNISISFNREQETVRYIVESTSDMDWSSGVSIEWDSSLGPGDLVPVGERQTVDVSLPASGSIFLRVNASE